MLDTWTYRVVRYRYAVVLIWIALSLAGLLAGTKLDALLTTSLEIPGSQSAQAARILTDHFDENTEGTFTVIYQFKNATAGEIDVMKSQVISASRVIPTAQVVQQRAFGGILTANIVTAFDLVHAAPFTEKLRSALSSRGLEAAIVTGPPAIKSDVTPVLADDLLRGQILAITLALLLLILMLGFSWAAAIPLIFAAMTISVTLGSVFLLAQKFLMVLYIPNIVELIGLGLAIDYSLLIVTRFRQEFLSDQSGDVTKAIVRTMRTAGRTVIVSGLTVGIGLATLLLVPVPFVRSLGAAGLIVPIVSVIAGLTVQPVLLALFGKRIALSKVFSGLMGSGGNTNRFFTALAHFVIARPRTVLLSSLALLGLLASSLIWLQVTPSSLTALPVQLESARGIDLVTHSVGPGVVTPSEIVIDLGAPGLASTHGVNKARTDLAVSISKHPEVFIVATGEKTPYVDSTGQFIRMYVIGRHAIGDEETKALVVDLREKYVLNTGFDTSAQFYIGGAPAAGVDLVHKILTSFPWIVLLALLLVFLFLVRAFRSLILPLKAIVLDLLSIAVAYASLVLVFRFGIGSSILGTYKLDQIEAWVLIFLFAVLFGLSMDYEVFIVSRIREARDRGDTNHEAIIDGFVHTGGVITGAAIILVGALSGLAFGHFAGLQELGIGLAIGILIDATIIRGLLLPSAMVLFSRWNWWLPQWLARITKSKASPLVD